MEHCKKLDRRFLNVSIPAAGFPEFHLVQHNVESWMGFANAATDFKNLIGSFAQCPNKKGRVRTLDLISHSIDPERFLALGSFVIGDDPGDADITFFHNLLDDLQDLEIRRIRLLGCETASSNQGISTIIKLSDALGIETCGTRRLLIASDFRPEGLKLTRDDDPNAVNDPTSCQKAQGSLIAEPRVIHPVIPEQARRVAPLDLDEVPAYTAHELDGVPGVTWPEMKLDRPLTPTQEKELYGFVGDVNRGVGHSLPGLLLAPSHAYWIPVGGRENTYRLVHILYSWNLLRVYSRTLADVPIPPHTPHYTVVNPYDSAVYRVADPRGLKAWMTALPGTPLPARHQP